MTGACRANCALREKHVTEGHALAKLSVLRRQIGNNGRCYKLDRGVTMATTNAARTDKVLVVDDDARIRDLLRRYLTQEGF